MSMTLHKARITKQRAKLSDVDRYFKTIKSET